MARPIANPYARCQRLRRFSFPRPVEYLRQQMTNELFFILWLDVAVRTGVCIVRLVPNVPGEDSLIVCKTADQANHILPQTWIFSFVLQSGRTRTLYPS